MEMACAHFFDIIRTDIEGKSCEVAICRYCGQQEQYEHVRGTRGSPAWNVKKTVIKEGDPALAHSRSTAGAKRP